MSIPPTTVHGVGLGLRAPLFDDLSRRPPPALRWLEVSPENHMARGGVYPAILEAARERWPVVTHGLTLSLGGPDPLDREYLRDVSAFVARVGSPWHSDHLCFASSGGAFVHDLLPVPFTREALDRCVARGREVKASLGVPFAVENISWYAHPGEAEMSEADFLTELLERAELSLLLDVNNVYVNARNHGFDAMDFIRALPLSRVVQLHVAGHWVEPDGWRIDTHGEPVCDEVYALLEETLRLTGPVPVLLERDQGFPSFDALADEVARLDEILRRAAGSR